jgi:hypothetical protein
MGAHGLGVRSAGHSPTAFPRKRERAPGLSVGRTFADRVSAEAWVAPGLSPTAFPRKRGCAPGLSVGRTFADRVSAEA